MLKSKSNVYVASRNRSSVVLCQLLTKDYQKHLIVLFLLRLHSQNSTQQMHVLTLGVMFATNKMQLYEIII